MSTLTPRLDKLDRNLVINGAFDFWQRVAGNTTSSTGTGFFNSYTADRFACYFNTTASKSVSIVRSTDVPTANQAGFAATYSYQFTNTNAIALSANDYYIAFNHSLEGLNYAAIGGPNKQFTVGFWFKSTLVGDYPISLRNHALDRSYVTTFNYPTANTWQFVQKTFTTDSGGTWNYDTTRGMLIAIAYGGSSWQVPSLNTWTAGAAIPSLLGAPTASVANFPGTAGAVFKIACFSITPGDGTMGSGSFARAATTIAGELALCQRYFEKSWNLDTPVGTATLTGCLLTIAANGSSGEYARVLFQVRKRVTPVGAFYSRSTGTSGTIRNEAGFDVASGTAQIGENSFHSTGGPVDGNLYTYHWTADAEL